MRHSRLAKIMMLMGGGGEPVPWYLEGGISAANCICAYQAIGAADYETSKINLANPALYNATDGVAYPTFDTSYGWSFDGTQYLKTGYTPSGTGNTIIARFSGYDANTDGQCICGSRYAATSCRFYVLLSTGLNQRIYGSGGALTITPEVLEGVMCVSGQHGYLNGVPESGDIPAWSDPQIYYPLYIGCCNVNGANYFSKGKIQAVAIYNVTLSPAQVAAVSAAMAVLPLA